jgi:uncharacterized protein (UPF0333 family)
MDNVHGEALEENKKFDEAKAAEAAAKQAAENAEKARLQAEADSQKAAELLEKIKSGNAENVKLEERNETSIDQNSIESSIENEPLSPLMQKYKEKIEECISNSVKLSEKAKKLKDDGNDKEYVKNFTTANMASFELFHGYERIGYGSDDIKSFIELPKKGTLETEK